MMVFKELILASKEQETARTEQTDEAAGDSQHTEVRNVLIPEPVDLTDYICKMDQHPIAHGGFADIWRATWNKQSGTCTVRTYLHSLPSLRRVIHF
jgi:hypothetical protein